MKKVIGRYVVEKPLAQGMHGNVYLAWDPTIERHVALKTLDHSLLPQADAAEILTRFKREAIAAGRLVHPHIVTIYESGEHAQMSFIAMEFA